MADKFQQYTPGLDSPGTEFTALTKDDATDIVSRPRALFVGTGGDVVVQDSRGTNTTFKNVPSGTTLAIRPMRLMNATTATDIVGIV